MCALRQRRSLAAETTSNSGLAQCTSVSGGAESQDRSENAAGERQAVEDLLGRCLISVMQICRMYDVAIRPRHIVQHLNPRNAQYEIDGALIRRYDTRWCRTRLLSPLKLANFRLKLLG